ncbi:hypothetical protein F0562_019865, partial [Nyssa sinensis]
VDALTTKRGKEGGWVVERLLNQLLIELDGADQRRGVYVIGATNRPEKETYRCHGGLIAIGRNEACENLSGADLSALLNEAAMAALEEKLTAQGSSDIAPLTIKEIHFNRALEKVSPSVSDKQKQYYKLLSESFRAI